MFTCDCIPNEEACCFQDQGCEEFSREECLDQGGVPQGPGSDCTITECIDPPKIVHEISPDPGTNPCTGYIDPRQESTNGVDLNRGLRSANILFNVPVFGTPAGGPVTPANFMMRECSGGPAPNVTNVMTIGGNPSHLRVIWSRPITLQEYTTLRANVWNASGIQILNLGDLGPGNSEPDRVDYGFLPDDIDQNGRVQPLDLLRMRQKLLGSCPPSPTCPDCGGEELYFDIDRGGTIQALDLLRWRQEWFGTGNATQPWAGIQLNCPQP